MSLQINVEHFEWATALLNWGLVVGGLALFGLFISFLASQLTSARGSVGLGIGSGLALAAAVAFRVLRLGARLAENKFLQDPRVIGSIVLTVFLALVMLAAFMNPKGTLQYLRGLASSLVDVFSISIRRVYALATLTLKESLRRNTLLVMVVIGVFFMFGSWFLPSSTENVELIVQNNINFVLTVVTWLTLPVVVLISCWGLPDDIKARSLHTVVTKPALRLEVLLGRLLGQMAVVTIILCGMGFVGYIWLVRSVPRDAAEKYLVARRPIMGDMNFLEFKDGQLKRNEKGVNVGDVWDFRGYIEGNTPARATWNFANVSPQAFGDELTLESTFQVFRTYKGDIDKGILAQFVFVKRDEQDKPLIEASAPAFFVNEFRSNVTKIPRKLTNDKNNEEVDLYEDLARDGKLTIDVRCMTGGQFIGMARSDLFIRASDGSFAWSYVKAMFGIWLMLVLLCGIGVSASCSMKGPVATVLTCFLLATGLLARDMLDQMAKSDYTEGQAFTASLRIVDHKNPYVELEDTRLNRTLQTLDAGPQVVLLTFRRILPRLDRYNVAQFISRGFDVPWDGSLLNALMATIGYLLPCLVIGYYSLKNRELEAK